MATTPTIATGIDWAEIADEMKQADLELDDDEQGYGRRVYLGTVFRWYPSGKFYTAWASGNLAPCPRCEGFGDIPNPDRDDAVWAAGMEANHWLTAALIDAYGPWFGRGWPDDLEAALRRIRDQQRATQPELPCPVCDGCGSEEAYRDDLWREAAEAEAEAHGYYLVNGDGDPCDLFVVEGFDPDDENLPK